MMNRNTDKISTLVDDELADWDMTPVMQSLRHDPAMQECWRNYHLIGDAMRGSLPKYICTDLADRIHDALEHEPVYFNPQTSPLPAVSGTHPRTKATIGFALAASMTAIAVFGVIGFDRETGLQVPPAAMIAAGSMSPADEAAPVLSSLLTEFATAEFSDQVAQRPRIQTVSGAGALPGDANLTEYLINYHRYAMPAGHDDPLSYLRVVSYGPSQ